MFLSTLALLSFASPLIEGESGLAFASNRGRGVDIYRVFDGNSERLTTDGSSYAPSWSPDGASIVFNSHRSGGWKLWIMDADGSNTRRLTDSAGGGFRYEYFGSFRPDGKSVVFERWDNKELNFEIHTIEIATKRERNLTDSAGHDRLPSYAPDGASIVFNSNRDGDEDIYVMRTDGSDIKNLTDNEHTDFAASFSPDGKTILFHSNRSGSFLTYLMDADGGGVRLLPGVSEGDHLQGWTETDSNTRSLPYRALRSPGGVWSSDGTEVALCTFKSGTRTLIAVNVETGERRPLLGPGEDGWLPAWNHTD